MLTVLTPFHTWVRVRSLLSLLIASVAGCSGSSDVKSVEMLDQRTGVTMAALLQPMAFTETGIYDLLVPDKQPSVVYLGPVEWDRSGDYTYLLWIQVAPGVGGHRLDDIRSRGTINMKLDDGTVELSPWEAPAGVTNPYRLVDPAGETAYFAMNVALLRRMAVSEKLVLKLRAADLSTIEFIPTQDTRSALQQFVIDRGVGF
jgi:hypothetical protein